MTNSKAGFIAIVIFALEVAILDEVGLYRPILLAPLRLQGEVGHAEGVDGHAIAVDEHAAVGRDGIAIGVEQSVGVVEGPSVGRIADAFLADEDVLGVHESHGGASHVTLESEAT